MSCIVILLILYHSEYKTQSLNKIALKKYMPEDTTPEMFPKVGSPSFKLVLSFIINLH